MAFTLTGNPLLGRRGRTFPVPQNPLFPAGTEERLFLSEKLLLPAAVKSDFSAIRKIALSVRRGRATFPFPEKFL